MGNECAESLQSSCVVMEELTMISAVMNNHYLIIMYYNIYHMTRNYRNPLH